MVNTRQSCEGQTGSVRQAWRTHLYVGECRLEAKVQLQRGDKLALLVGRGRQGQVSGVRRWGSGWGTYDSKACEDRQGKPRPGDGRYLGDPSLDTDRHFLSAALEDTQQA